MTAELRTDFDALKNGDRVTLYPRADNPIHKKPVSAIYDNGYFYCAGSPPEEGPDYYMGDVLKFNDGFAIH